MYLLLIKSFLSKVFSSKTSRYAFLICVAILLLSISFRSLYSHIYNKGYNDAYIILQKDIDNKYNKALEEVKKENQKRIDIEKQALEDALKKRTDLEKQIDISNDKMKELIKNSKSNLVNKNCKVSKQELDFYNED